MSFSSSNFLSLDNPPTLGFNDVPTYGGTPNDSPWMSIFSPSPKRKHDPVLSPAELEEANKFVDAVFADGDGEYEAAFDPTSMPPPSSASAASTATESGGGLPVAPLQEDVDGMVVERPKDLPRDWHVIGKIRKLGKTAGQKDKYYVQKSTGRKLRSLKRVRLFLETGSATIRKPGKKVKKGNSQVSDDNSKGKRPVEKGDNGEVKCQMPTTSVLP